MKNDKPRALRDSSTLLDLGRYIVADPRICHGKPTIKGTRIMVWQILDELAHGMTVDDVIKAWEGKVSREAVAESIHLARTSLLDGRGRLRHPKELAAA